MLFSGTIRTNLDPFSVHEDAHLWSSLQRSYLIEAPNATSDDPEKTTKNNFTLESPVEPEGANLSVGERSLLSLARALVKDSKVVVMDEATSVFSFLSRVSILTPFHSASVDLETDNKIQRTIQSEFEGCTVLCIARKFSHAHIAHPRAHPIPDRLRTIISYDRILVLDAGKVAVRAHST